MGVLSTIGGIAAKGLEWAAANPKLITGAMALAGKGLQGLYGQQSESESQGGNQSQSQGGGVSESKSEGGTNDEVIQDYLKQFYNWQGGQNAFQSQPFCSSCHTYLSHNG